MSALVQILQCTRRACGHVMLEQERVWVPSEIGKQATCPMCSGVEFSHLKANGQAMTMRDINSEARRNGIEPTTIEASPRMGKKMKAAMLAVKERAMKLEGEQ